MKQIQAHLAAWVLAAFVLVASPTFLAREVGRGQPLATFEVWVLDQANIGTAEAGRRLGTWSS